MLHATPRRRLRGRATLLAAATSVLVATLLPVTPAAADVTTNRGDVARSAWYANQPGLSPDAVASGSFGQLFATQLDGVVTAQPLVVGQVVVVGTQNDWVYGLDRVTGSILWSRKVGEYIRQKQTQGCGDLVNSGVTATPVAAADGSAVYLTAKTYRSGTSGPMDYQLHAIDPTDGHELPGFPVTYEGSADNDASWTFDATFQTQRPGLLLDQGVVYAAFGSVCDFGTFTGWVMGVDVGTGAITSRWVSEAGRPKTAEGGIWQAGTGLSSDGPGQILLVSGNGDAPSMPTAGANAPGALGQSIVRLQVGADRKLSATDFFTPASAEQLNVIDADFGSGGVVLLPPDPFSTAEHPRLVASIGKEGTLYLLDAADLGGAGTGVGGGDRTVAKLSGLGGVWGSPAAFPGAGGYLYLTATGAPGFSTAAALTAVRWGLGSSGEPELTVVGRSADQPGFGSGSPVVTSNGPGPSSALVWQTWNPTAGGEAELRAYRAEPVAGVMEELWSAPIGKISKFMSPAVDGNRLYVGSADGVLYGFGSPTTQAFSVAQTTFSQVPIASTASGSVTLTANRPATLTGATFSSGPFALASGAPSLPVALAEGEQLVLPVTFSPSGPGSSTSTLVLAAQGEADQRVSATGQGVYATGHLAWQLGVLNLGTATLGSPTVTASALLLNDGATPVTIAAATAPSPPLSLGSSLLGTTIAPGASVSVPVRLATGQLGSFTGSATVATAAGQTSSLAVLGAVGTASLVEIGPAQVSFGTVPVGSSVTRTLTLRNTGSTAAAVTISKPPGLAASEITNLTDLPEGSTIPPLGQVNLQLRFAPTTPGSHVDGWEISTGDLLGRRSVRLSGSAVASNELPGLRVHDLDLLPGYFTANFQVSLDQPATKPVTFTAQTLSGDAPENAFVALRPTRYTIPVGETSTTVWTWVSMANGTGTSFNLQLSKVANAKLVDQVATARFLAPGAISSYFAWMGERSAPVNQVEAQVVKVPVNVTAANRPVIKCEVHTVDGTATAAAGDYLPISSALVTVGGGGRAYLPVVLPASPAAYVAKTFDVVVDQCSGNARTEDASSTVTLLGQQGRASVLEASEATTVLRSNLAGTTASRSVTLTNVGGKGVTIRRVVPPKVAYGYQVTSAAPLPVTIGPGARATFTVTWQAQASTAPPQGYQLAGSTTLKLNLLGRLR